MTSTITFITLEKTLELTFTEADDSFLIDLVHCFKHVVDFEKQIITIDSTQKVNSKLLTSVSNIAKKFGEFSPAIFRLQSFFQHIPHEESFFILPITIKDISVFDRFKLQNELSKINNLEYVNQEKLNLLFDKVETNFKFSIITEKYTTGEPNKKKRICRFCGEKTPNVKFKKKAHAIPEGLGNKNIIGHNECDVCNTLFGNTIENDLIALFDIERTLYGIQGKKGIPTFKTSNQKIAAKRVTQQQTNAASSSNPSPNLHITISTTEEIKKIDEHKFQIELKNKLKFKKQNIYKALCKCCISCLSDFDYINHKQLCDWVRSDLVMEKLPLIISYTSTDFRTTPSLNIFERKNNRLDLPNIFGEFSFLYSKFIFILPFIENETRKFDKEEDFNELFEIFTFYNNVPNKKFLDFSSTMKITKNNIITFVPQ